MKNWGVQFEGWRLTLLDTDADLRDPDPPPPPPAPLPLAAPVPPSTSIHVPPLRPSPRLTLTPPNDAFASIIRHSVLPTTASRCQGVLPGFREKTHLVAEPGSTPTFFSKSQHHGVAPTLFIRWILGSDVDETN